MDVPFQGAFDRATFFRAVALANHPVGRALWWRVGLFVLFSGIFVAYFAVVAVNWGDAEPVNWATALRHVWALPFLIYFILQPYIGAYLTARRLWADPGMQAPQAGVVSSQGMAYVSSVARRDLTWEQFARIRVRDDLIALVTADGVLAALPRAWFASDADWSRVRGWVAHRTRDAR